MTLIDLTIIFALCVLTLTCLALVGVVVVGLRGIKDQVYRNADYINRVEAVLDLLNLHIRSQLRELNQDAGDIKRRQRWSSKREKKVLKKI